MNWRHWVALSSAIGAVIVWGCSSSDEDTPAPPGAAGSGASAGTAGQAGGVSGGAGAAGKAGSSGSAGQSAAGSAGTAGSAGQSAAGSAGAAGQGEAGSAGSDAGVTDAGGSAGAAGGDGGLAEASPCQGSYQAAQHTSCEESSLVNVWHKPGLEQARVNCVSCHGQALQGGVVDAGGSAISCYSCHESTLDISLHTEEHDGLMHMPDGGGSTTGTHWTDSLCAPCHGDNAGLGNPNGLLPEAGVGCKTCHPDG